MSKTLRWVAVPTIGLALALAATAAPPMSGPKVAAADTPSVGAAGSSPLAAQPHEREVSGIVAEMLGRYHYEDVPLDDAASAE